MDNIIFWGIHAGRTGDAHNIFIKEKVVALGWVKAGDLSQLDATREAFKERIEATYPQMKPGAIPGSAGQLFRFMHEMKKGDLVIYPSKRDRQIHIGRITGDYFYAGANDIPYPNRRNVEWLKVTPRTTFSQGALYEIGSALSFFQVKNYADEFLAVIEGKRTITPAEDDDTIAYVAEDIEQFTHDFILRKLSRELKGHPFAFFVAHLLTKMGYITRIAPEGPDGGIDIIAHKDELGFEPPIIKVQVKSVDGNVGDPVVSALYGKVDKNEYGLIVTLGSFTRQAISFAQNKSNLRLIDGEEIVDLIFKYYEQLDSKYKGILPLKRVYVPEVIPDQNE
jgi:restriction system protein